MTQTTLEVHGSREVNPETPELAHGLPPGTVTLKYAVRADAARAGVEPLHLDGLAADDVVEIELEDGLRVWSRVDDLQAQFAAAGSRAGVPDASDDAAIVVPASLTLGPVSRSAGGWAIKGLRVLGLDIEGEIADYAARHVEDKLRPGPGLYRCVENDPDALQDITGLDGTGPVLVFLHGTASSTSGSFGGLWAPESGPVVSTLFRHYNGRVLAFQHKTLSVSPVANALDLTEQLAAVLPQGAEVHLVSHSRGGLVGELLARGMREGAAPFTPDDLAVFDGAAYKADRETLEALSERLANARFRVTTFVRVACPARGTTLADRRLDRYFSVFVNGAALVPGLRANPVYEGLTSLLAGVLKRRASPEDLPGLEAMMPTSPLVRMLNNPDVKTAADLHVLGGDIAGVGFIGRLKALATDLYYRDDHDLVVNTPAMFGGTARLAPIRYWVDTGGQVTHFNYFRNADTASRLVAALTGTSAQFRTLKAAPSTVTSADYTKRSAVSLPIVVMLPGIMGSELSLDDRPVWVSIRALAGGGLTALGLDAPNVKAKGLLGSGYGALREHLAQTHEVVPFPYDWRRSLEESAAALAALLGDLLPLAETAGQPIRLLAHSMGGLVVRAMLQTKDGAALWARACQHDGSRFIMLGTPTRGSFSIPALLMGRDPLVKKLALVDVRNSHAELLATIAAFPGVLHLLPHDGDGTPRCFDPAWWTATLEADAPETRGLFNSSVETSKSAGFRWTVPAAKVLREAKELLSTLVRTPLDAARVIYVAGHAPETPCDVVVDAAAKAGRKVRVLASRRGDGRVLWDTGIPAGVLTYYMPTVHGDMANDRRHFAALVELLEHGSTSRLDTQPPVSRAADETFEVHDRQPAMVPDEQELIADALGGSRLPVTDGPAEAGRIRVRVLHDNLTNARHPVLASHYRHDVIVAAEKYLDRQLGGRLSELLHLELYPGPVNTAAVVLNDRQVGDDAVHPGAIIAGLGVVGELTPGRLTSTLAHALTVYGADLVGRERRRRQRLRLEAAGGSVQAAVCAILIGSGEGGVSLTDSVRALLRAVQQANQRLRQVTRATDAVGAIVAQIDTLDIIELYEDRAVEALHALRALTNAPEFADFEPEAHLVDGGDGLRRVRMPQTAGWWQRLRITADTDGALSFEAVTQTSRAPARLRATQRELVEGFLDQAQRSTRDDARLGHTLFQMLVPHDFKSYAPERHKLALLLDPKAAAYPWELLRDGFDRAAEPLAVAGGLVRQLLEANGRSEVLRATKDTALVIGDPVVNDRRFPPLRGARDEADAVAKILVATGHYEVRQLLEREATPMAVLTAIHEQQWRILHLAAHGVFEHDVRGKKVSGLVLDQELFFTADEADQMQYVPELVFINCCHLGQTRGDARDQVRFHRLAANLATQFIRMGARAVVAAGWAVDDLAAKTFATTFYDRMLSGSYYGDAVFDARRATYTRHGSTNTWGAYQCYGDPSFSLTAGRPAWTRSDFVAQRELALWLEEVSSRTREGGNVAAMLQDVEARLAVVPERWLRAADVCGAAGMAFLSLQELERAIHFFDTLVRAERANAPVTAVEQFANCRVRLAERLARAEPPDLARAATELDQAEAMIRNLLAIGHTAERWSLLGGTMKRRAMFATASAARREHLVRMRDAYDAAWQVSLKAAPPGDPYPLANHLAAAVVLQWGAGEAAAKRAGRAAIAQGLDALAEAAESSAHRHTDAFNLVARTERLVLRGLMNGTLSDKERQAIEDGFRRGLSRGATPRELGSVRTQFHFFRTMAKTELPKEKGDRLAEQLNGIQKSVLGGT